MSLYAWLMLCSFVGPFLLSFDKKVAFYKQWPGLFIGIFLNGLIFIIWDGWFTRMAIWSFNPDFVWHLRFNDLPLEEWSFFFVVPYASIFIYACIKSYFSDRWLLPFVKQINLIYLFLLATGIVLYNTHTYTLVNLSIAFLLLLLHHFYIKGTYMAYFWIAYLVHLLPFLLVNGVLTAVPVVLYNPQEIIGWRIYTIPIEDTVYAFTCLLLPITVLEWFNNRKALKFR